MDKNIIKEQEYVRVDEAPKTITYEGENGGEKYVRCDTIEQDLEACKIRMKEILETYPPFVNAKFSPIAVRLLWGNNAFFVIRKFEFNPNTKFGSFGACVTTSLKTKIAHLFSSFNARYKDVSYLKRGETPEGNEIWELGYQAVFRNKKPK
ncbi:hypothetical protein [Helicobacter marmotae]|uniref:Uncharacterized protein n=1 Tax=Helicobacter marmotae TaxID=152490 RepID=A0A3D8I412_9HELI|nr:hypothetical protein [Helicobacter marmotae]RDU59893.1 hypothetical protein CQA63_04745 [Helicobacter marmotae]